MSASKNSADDCENPFRNPYKYKPLTKNQPPASVSPGGSDSSDSWLNGRYEQPKINFETCSSPFDTNQTRNEFAKKVLSIVALQLAVILVGAASISFFFKSQLYAANHPMAIFALFGGWALSTTALCTFTCIPSTRTTTPTNYIIFGVFTLAQTLIAGFIASQVDGQAILLSMTITFLVVFGIAALAFTNIFDITNWSLVLLLLVVVHFVADVSVFAVAYFFNVWSEPLFTFLGVAGAFLFTFYLLHDLQSIIGGKHKEIGPDDSMMASIMIYLDIIQIFYFVLRVVDLRRKK